jgi:hypothetical protein
MRKAQVLLISTLLFFSACKLDTSINPITTTTTPVKTSTGFYSRYVAIGDSQTAGYANDGLYNWVFITPSPIFLQAALKALA